jgi:putative copper export protein/mono/diheme cytochrome c family protein
MLNGSFPAFAPEGGLALALVLGAWLATLLSGFGALTFRALVAPTGGLVARISLAAALVAGLALLLARSADMAGVAEPGAVLAAARLVLVKTTFGHLIATQLIAVALALALSGWRVAPILACGAALVLQVGHSHAWSMTSGVSWVVASYALHVVAAGAWLGGLLPLALLLRRASPEGARRASLAFSRLGMACVAALAVTAVYQGSVLIGSPAALAGTAYGWMAVVKATLLLALIGFAIHHRWGLTPALAGAAPETARRRLARGVATETGAGLAIVLAAGLLASLPPAMHMQPVWPFTERFSLSAVNEDPDFRREALEAALALGGAAALLVLAALVRRRAGLAAVAAAGVIAWFAAPHLDLLLVPAHPTSFYRSPTGFTATDVAEGAALYPAHCAACHGAEGRGDGPAAQALADPPANLDEPHLWMHSDGEMFWWLAHGIEGPDGKLAMPGFEDALFDDQRWALIDAIRARNAGLAYAASGNWPAAVLAPDFAAACDGMPKRLSELRGEAALVVVTEGGAQIEQGGKTCTADDPAIPAAYALVAGVMREAAAGVKALVDRDGFLRVVHTPGHDDWTDPARLSAEIARVDSQPLAPAAASMDMPAGMRM